MAILVGTFLLGLASGIIALFNERWDLPALIGFALSQGLFEIIGSTLWVVHRGGALFALASAVPFLMWPLVLLVAGALLMERPGTS